MVSHTALSFKDHKTGEVKEVVFTATLLEVMEGVVGKITDTGIAFVEEQGELSIYTNPTPEQIDKFENNVVPAFRVQDIIGVHTNDYHLESNCGLPDENTDNEFTEEWDEVIEEEIPESDEISDDDIEQVSDYPEDHPEYCNK